MKHTEWGHTHGMGEVNGFCFFRELGGAWTSPSLNTLASVSSSGHWWGLEYRVSPISSILECNTQSCQSALFGKAGDLSL